MNIFESTPSPPPPPTTSSTSIFSSVASSPSSSPTSLETTSNNSIFSSWIFWLIIIVFLAYAGFNIFNYLAKGTQTVANIIGPLTKILATIAGGTASQTVYSAAEGTKGIAQGVGSAATTLQKSTQPQVSSPPKNLNDSLQAPQKQTQTKEYDADDATSSTQQTKKSGWCFIGETNGVKNCVKVDENDTCQSGIVTQEKC
jgi:hypothetical protein